MKKLIVHMGVHRAGSTALQSYLKASKTALDQTDTKLLVRENMKGVAFKGNFTKLKNMSQSSLIRKYLEKQIVAELHKIPNRQILISEENLIGGMPVMRSGSKLPYPKLENFLQSLSNWQQDFEILPRVIVRRQDRWIESLYAFQIYRGLAARFSEFTAYFSKINLDWNVLLDSLQQHGLLENSSIAPLQCFSGKSCGEWVPDFLALNPAAFEDKDVGTNERMLVRDLKVFWALNKIGWAKGRRGERRNLRRKLVQMSSFYGERELEKHEIKEYLSEAGIALSKQQLKHVEGAYLGMEFPGFTREERQNFIAPYRGANQRFLSHPSVCAPDGLWSEIEA